MDIEHRRRPRREELLCAFIALFLVNIFISPLRVLPLYDDGSIFRNADSTKHDKIIPKNAHVVQEFTDYGVDNDNIPMHHQTEEIIEDRNNILTDVLLENFIVVPEYKLLFCYVAKVGCTMFNKLFYDLVKEQEPEEGGFWYQNNPRFHHMSKKELEQVLMNPEWTKAVFYREPKERFLSGYASKCVPGRDHDGEHHCYQSFGLLHPDFDQVLHQMETEYWRKRAKGNEHFREVGDSCGGLTNTLQYYDIVEKLSKETSPMKVQNMLEKVGVEKNLTQRLVDKYVTSSQAQTKAHVTNADKNLCTYYTSPAKIKLIEDTYKNDYKLFNMSRNENLC